MKGVSSDPLLSHINHISAYPIPALGVNVTIAEASQFSQCLLLSRRNPQPAQKLKPPCHLTHMETAHCKPGDLASGHTVHSATLVTGIAASEK